MKTRPSIPTAPTAARQTAALGLAALAVSLATATASLTIDLQASAIDPALGVIAPDLKTITLNNGATGTITLQVWAQVQNATPTTSDYGLQRLTGSVISQTASGTVAGAMSTFAIGTPWTSGAFPGEAFELSTPPDLLADRGDSSPASSVGYIRLRKDPAASGTQVGTVFFATNHTPLGATFQPVANGFEFLMGSLTVTVTRVAQVSATLNWAVPAFATATLQGTAAVWTEADGFARTGQNDAALLAVGSPVTLASTVPEPATCGLLALGALGLLGRHRGGPGRRAA